MTGAAPVAPRWVVGAADDPDPGRATVFRLDDGRGYSRVLDRVSHVLFPPVPTSDVAGRQPWYPAPRDLEVADLLVGVTVHDDVASLHSAQRASARTSLGAPRAQIRQWDPHHEIVLSRRDHVFPADGPSTWAALLSRLRQLKGRVEVAAYVDVDPSTAHWLPDWLRLAEASSPKGTRSSLETTQHHDVVGIDVFAERWLLGADDRLRIFPVASARRHQRSLLDRMAKVWTDRTEVHFEVQVADHGRRADRYAEAVGFADIVVLAAVTRGAFQWFPTDLWSGRSNAVMVPARSPHAERLLTRLAAIDQGAVFLIDPSSTRVWQHLTGRPDIARLETCLLKLVQTLRHDHDAPGIQAELGTFLRSVCVGGLPEPERSRLRTFIRTNDELAKLDLDLD